MYCFYINIFDNLLCFLLIFQNELGDNQDDYILFDCPGQIELYTHMDTMKK